MAVTLHEAFVPSCQQILTAMQGLVDKAQQHVEEHGLADAELIEARLCDTMWDLPWHVRSVWVHSAYAISLLPTGEFSPDFTEQPRSWDAMRAQLETAQDALAAVTVDQLEEVAELTVGFVIGGKRLMEFKAQDFLLSFSQPNFYFHATTFYDILRMKGVEIGKRDYLGVPRIKTA
ncbi:DUF1993 domain-containing protein [Qipengyuania qiaonensis]|uniref:DUF1993 domain-containing protein n=1 Tax=Qipengyuania qiaonensis TaxID=2867240 RepID=A0ABS7J8Z4_9SPHN|nr:DUF1993 domain-containing protein [Qipengyuania qiaonensis]MBX7483788.1 DUF1993 domain-containing protein [Qipengyuania qiaonensis]